MIVYHDATMAPDVGKVINNANSHLKKRVGSFLKESRIENRSGGSCLSHILRKQINITL